MNPTRYKVGAAARLSRAGFADALIEGTPHIGGYRSSLRGPAPQAADLVQDAMNAWMRDRFLAGANFQTWMFVLRDILLRSSLLFALMTLLANPAQAHVSDGQRFSENRRRLILAIDG